MDHVDTFIKTCISIIAPQIKFSPQQVLCKKHESLFRKVVMAEKFAGDHLLTHSEYLSNICLDYAVVSMRCAVVS